jgi:hypothetical protein
VSDILKAGLVLLAVLCAGCGDMEHIPSKVYKIQTVDGVVLNLYCPTVDRGRSTMTYLISNEC